MNRPRWSPWIVGSTIHTPAIMSDSRSSSACACSRSGLTRRRSGSGRRPSAATPAAGAASATTTASLPIRLSSRRGMSMMLAVVHHDRVLDLAVRRPRSRRRWRVNGPMKLSTIRVPAPIASRPADRRVDDLGAGLDDDPAVDRPSRRRPCRRSACSIFSSSSRFASSSGVSLPVSIHQPVSSSQPHAVAVVDQPLDRVGDLQLAAIATARSSATASWIVGSNRYTPTSARSDGGSAGFSTRRTTWPSASSVGDAEPVRIGHLLQQDLGRRRRRRRSRAASNADTNAARSCSSRLSPRYITKSSSPRNSRAISTQWARPSGASCGMYVIDARTASRRRARPSPRRGCRRR